MAHLRQFLVHQQRMLVVVEHLRVLLVVQVVVVLEHHLQM
jgi:hypothetical protein